jgi:hypothetical protein
MIRFNIRAHSTRDGEEMIEVMRDGEFVGALYPQADGVRFVSAYDGAVQACVESTGVARLRRIDIEIQEKRLT